MFKRPNIKWRESDEKELERITKNFNAKIERNLKKHPELKDILPDKVTKRDLKSEITTRQEFKKEINSLNRFLKRGAEKTITSKTGVTVTKWERKEIGIKVAGINRQRTIERKAAENTEALTRGKPVGLKRGEMGNVRTQELKKKKFDFNKIKPGKEWEKFVESVEKQSKPSYNREKAERYKQNYIQALVNNLGDLADDLIDTIQQIPAKLVVETYYADEQAFIDFPYDPIAAQIKLDILSDMWESVLMEYETGDDDN